MRALAEFLFDDEQAMIRLDMSEYMENTRYLGCLELLQDMGHEEGGQLTEAVRRRLTRLCCLMKSKRRTLMCSTPCFR